MTIILTGKSSSGKDKIKNILIKMFNYKPIVSHSTRPIRINEVNHKDYHFVTEAEFYDIMMLETRSYDVIFEGIAQTWFYGTSLKELDKKGDRVCIKDLEGAIKLKEHIKDSIIAYIEVPEEIRKQRAIERGSFCELEFTRRVEQDSKDFDEELIEKHCEYFVYNYGDVEYLLEQTKDLVSFIKFQKEKQMSNFKPEHLNQNLVAINGVSYEAQLQLCELYDKLEALILSSKGELLTRADYDILSDKVTELEFELQRLWGFPQDEEFHRYWLSVGNCSCPKMDNMDRLGYGRTINLGCPVHGTPQDI